MSNSSRPPIPPPLVTNGGVDDKGRRYESLDQLWESLLKSRSAGNTSVVEGGNENDVEVDDIRRKKSKREHLHEEQKGECNENGEHSVCNADADINAPLPAPSLPAESPEGPHDWYSLGANYWMGVEATYNGVLGGFAHLHPIDISSSADFISRLPHLSPHRSIDCGAGVGRVARHLLSPLFGHVDMVEQNPIYVKKAMEDCKAVRSMEEYYTCGLQDFAFPTHRPYNLIWIQWVISHLTDDDCVAFLKRCKGGMAEASETSTSYIVLKENTCKDSDGFVYDTTDGSITRCNPLFYRLFAKAGLMCVKEEIQSGFPKKLFPVRMWALVPVKSE